MRLTKFFKRMVAVSLAVVVAVTAIPYPFSVKAASDDYPDEIYFPVQVLDFRKDELFFEWNTTWASYFEFQYKDYFGKGKSKGLVEDTLGDNGLPVYKKETVEIIALGVLDRMLNNSWTAIMLDRDRDISKGDYNDLSIRKYVKGTTNSSRSDVKILPDSTSSTTLWEPTDTDAGITYSMTSKDPSSTYVYNGESYSGVKAEVYATDDPAQTPLYLLRDDDIVLLSDVSVSRTFTGLSGSYIVDDSLWKGDGTLEDSDTANDYSGKVRVLVNDVPVVKGSVVRPDFYGNLKVTIELAETVTDVAVEGYEQLAVGNISLKPYTNSSWKTDVNVVKTHLTNEARVPGYKDNGNNTLTKFWTSYNNSRYYPLGNYEESKAKFDNNPDIGWTHITTCMDYAYFVTSNLFQYNASLNTLGTDYDNLIFHKVIEEKADSTGATTKKVFYEFAADGQHPSQKLIYNKTDKTVRNVTKTDTGNSAAGDEVRSGGSMFIADDIPKAYPESIDSGYNGHNFHFSITSHSRFVYKKDAKQTFSFSGDDDVYVFVNGHLFMDLGGAHSQWTATIDLDQIAYEHADEGWVQDGKPVSLDFFYMERHTTASNFYAKLNFKLATDEVGFDMPYESIPYGYLVDLKYNLTTLRELTTNTNLTFTDNFGNVIGADGFYLAEGVCLKDDKLMVTVTDENGNVDETRSRTFEFVDPNNPTVAEVAAVKSFFENLKVKQGEKVEISGPQYDTSSKAYDEYEDVAGESVNTKSLDFKTIVTYDAWQEGAQVPTKSSESKDTIVNVLTGGIKLCTAPVDNEKKDLADYGVFTIDRDTSLESDKSGAFHYENDPEDIGRTEETLDKLSRGKYTLRLDPNVLTSYKVMINDEEVTELTLDFEPTYDPDAKTWIYPDVKFELRAKRPIPDLKDLT